jgi:methylated-DNA-[protein]-cysteine S-methyltransferase
MRGPSAGKENPRAVGAANWQNPLPLTLPCHRLNGARGSLTGLGDGLPMKHFLLEHEGALLPIG